MSRKPRLCVRGPEGKRPFLRGMLTHSLLHHGLPFKEALAVASLTRERLAELAENTQGELEISPQELRQFVWRLVGELYGEQRREALEKRPADVEPTVLHAEGAVPFSRGLLSQKLVGTGMDPRLAYETAQEVWGQLRHRPGACIHEDELRGLERDIVVERHGETFGKRYDAIEDIARSSRPIVVLVGGATGCGKSTLATEVAYRLGIRKIASTDMIREIMRRLLSPDILPSIHVSSFEVKEGAAPSSSVLAGFLEQVMRVEVGITASIRRAVLENFHLVVEGIHVVPPVKAAAPFERSAIIIPVVVATLDRAVLGSRFSRRGKERLGARRAKKYLGSIDDIMRIQDHILEQADLHDVPIVQNVSFDEAAAELLKVITDRIHQVTRPEVPTP